VSTASPSGDPDNDLDTALGERYYEGSKDLEEKYTSEIVEAICGAIKGHFEQRGGPARRDAHAFDNGCVRAVFRVDADLDSKWCHGVFVPGKEYPAWIRFSNGNSERRPAWFFDARGMAIKLMGVRGTKLLDDEKHTQDFVLINHPVFFVDDLKRYRATLVDFLKGSYLDQYLWSLLRLRPREIWLALRVNLNFAMNPLFQQYWSMTPYRLGTDPATKTAVKYTAKPRVHEVPNLLSQQLTRLAWNFSLKEEMSKTLTGNETWFDFYIQRYADQRMTPIEDSKVEWKSELLHVAKIIIPVQDVTSLAQDRFCENLSFSPWHSLPEHKPLGLVNRVRKIAYHRISKLRHELNHVPLQEPTGGEVFDPHAKNALDDSASE